jgi:predicted GIY-YIG superfamily endonuclease
MAPDPQKRLANHNSGKNSFTKGHRPWKIIFTEENLNGSLARKREKYLKSAAGKIWWAKYVAKKGGDSGYSRAGRTGCKSFFNQGL